jgi:hypothetical protein
MPRCDTKTMNLHLAEIAAEVAPGAHAVLLVDQAGWHMSNRLVVPRNITITPLPPKCPELNPVENVWQLLRDNWLSNRIFKSYNPRSLPVTHGTNSSICPGKSCPSVCATGRIGSRQRDLVLLMRCCGNNLGSPPNCIPPNMVNCQTERCAKPL